MTPNALIEIVNVGFQYVGAEKVALKNISLSIQKGEVVAIVGPNGSGKTTTLKAIAGELTSKGHIAINGHDIRALEPWQLAVKRAVLPQAATIAFPFTVREIVRLGLTVGPNRHADRIEAVTTEALAAVDLAGFAGRFYQELSGGEQQRVQLARCLAQLWHNDAPRGWLFLDEPTSALDLYYQQHLLRLLKRLTRSGQLHVCVVLHDLNLAALWADRILLLHQGKLVAEGTPQEVICQSVISRWYGAEVRMGEHPDIAIPQVYLAP